MPAHSGEVVRRICRHIWECYRNCLEANILLRAWWPRKTYTSRVTSNNELIDRLLSPKKESRAQGVALCVVATLVTAGVVGYWYRVEFAARPHGPVYFTGTVASTQALPDGSQMSLSKDSILAVDDTGPQLVAFQKAGEIIYKIRATPARPFVLQTLPATIVAIADATLRIAIDRNVDIEVMEGAAKVLPRGANAGGPSRWLFKGESLRVPIDGARSELAQDRSSATVNIDG